MRKAKQKKLRVADLQNNPFRDLELNPIDDDRVLQLMDSMERDGVWHGLIARPTMNGHQLAFGHHRLEALKRLDKKEVEVDVVNLTDAQMLQYLSDENLTQGGKSPAAVVEVVSQAYELLVGYLQVADTPEEFFDMANISVEDESDESQRVAPHAGNRSDRVNTSFIRESDWMKVKQSGEIGHRLVRMFLSTQRHGKGSWNDHQLQQGIQIARDRMRVEEVKGEVEVATATLHELEQDDEVETEELQEAQEQVAEKQQELQQAEKKVGQDDLYSLFPNHSTGKAFTQEVKRKYSEISKEGLIEVAEVLIEEGCSAKAIPDRMIQLIEGDAALEAELDSRAFEANKEKSEAEEASRAERETAKRYEGLDESISPHRFVSKNIHLFNQMEAFLRRLKPVFDDLEVKERARFGAGCAKLIEELDHFVKAGKTVKREKVLTEEGEVI